jgi:NAD-dependent dihydropyrimidine dehydrogenase PreA subunit
VISIKNKIECCGCTACVNICPKKCIYMIEDEEGFLYPQADRLICVECGMCEKVCPILNKEEEEENPNQIGAIVAHKDLTIRKQSTSGGAFTALAEYIISNNGVVFGVEMNEQYFVRHIEIDKVEEIRKFRNSKYVQSDLGHTYSKIKEYLDNGKFVCFSGTPCQIEGLRHFLRKEYGNLILVDVMCRAVPSPGVWRKYVQWLESINSKLEAVRFRDKALGYQFSTMVTTYKNGNVIRNGIESDAWLRMFFSGMIIRPSCTDCKFRRRYRNSDFTIWDCFNVSDLSKKFDEKLGATRILIHTEKGKHLFHEISGSYDLEMVSPDILVKGLTELSHSPQEHKYKKDFFLDYGVIEFDDLLKKYFPINSKVYIKKYVRLLLNKVGLDIFIKKLKRKIY